MAHLFDIVYEMPMGDMVDCKLALRGLKVPPNYENDVVKFCITRGIRYHPGFATELRETIPQFRRALNARSILSNEIPTSAMMKSSEDIPYCIWHPEIASEETYRELASRFPQTKYQVGRACAVAGYTDLYKDLELLPDVHIAEEARDNDNMDIFDWIMTQPILYEVMDDYELVINVDTPRAGAVLNADTAVLSYLKHRNKVRFNFDPEDGERTFKHSWILDSVRQGQIYNITEDWNLDLCGSKSSWRTEVDIAPLLYNPLPLHLPNINKNLLILMAAYHGNIDRYARLRRPYLIEQELQCLIRGIYHNTAFAKWCALHEDTFGQDRSRIANAITARYIMSDNLSRSHMQVHPDVIWFPQVARPETYEKLVEVSPNMREEAARAMIVGDYQESFTKLDPEPSHGLLLEAKASTNPFYNDFLCRKAKAQGKDPDLSKYGGDSTVWGSILGWADNVYTELLEYTDFLTSSWRPSYKRKFMTEALVDTMNQQPGWDETSVSVRRVEHNMLVDFEERWNEPEDPDDPDDQYSSDNEYPESDWEIEAERKASESAKK